LLWEEIYLAPCIKDIHAVELDPRGIPNPLNPKNHSQIQVEYIDVYRLDFNAYLDAPPSSFPPSPDIRKRITRTRALRKSLLSAR
jgi:hypothetical protein